MSNVHRLDFPPKPLTLAAIRDEIRDAHRRVDGIFSVLLDALVPPLSESDDDELNEYLSGALVELDNAITTIERIVNEAGVG